MNASAREIAQECASVFELFDDVHEGSSRVFAEHHDGFSIVRLVGFWRAGTDEYDGEISAVDMISEYMKKADSVSFGRYAGNPEFPVMTLVFRD